MYKANATSSTANPAEIATGSFTLRRRLGPDMLDATHYPPSKTVQYLYVSLGNDCWTLIS
jgi:hypothetical protein